MKSFADKIRRSRLSRRMTQEQVAELAGINPKYLGEIERGLKSPTAAVVHNLARALKVPVCALMSQECCPCEDGTMPNEVSALFAGKKENEVRKAVKLLEVLFE